MNNERNRTALVTGSASGIGSAIANELAKTSSIIIGLDRSGVDQSKVRQQCEAHGATFIEIAADVSSEDSVAKAYEEIDRIGRLDIVVHSAGVSAAMGRTRATEETSLADWQKVIGVNLTGTFLICRSAIPRLKRNGWGRIITIGSQTARDPSLGAGSYYCASKAGVRMFTMVLALELAPHGITVNCVSPGLTRTPMTTAWDLEAYAKNVPLGRVGEPGDLAGAVAFVASDAASYITGATIDVNGGMFMG